MGTIFNRPKLLLLPSLLMVSSLLFFPLACSKTYLVEPLPAGSIATSTNTPCGYPGNTCTMTFTRTGTPTPTVTFTATVTFTRTHTGTPPPTGTFTSTRTITPTSTPTALPAPRGFFGFKVTTSGHVQLVWLKDTIPEITVYDVYMSTDGVDYNLYGSFPVSDYTKDYCFADDPLAGTTFDRYYYIVASNGGVPPDSAPSRIVHAVSSAGVTGSLTLSTFMGGTPVYHTITAGTVPGGVKRVWAVNDSSLYNYWFWGEEAASLTTVNYGNTSPTGITYVPSETLSSGVTYFINALTLNDENWSIDWSDRGFIIP